MVVMSPEPDPAVEHPRSEPEIIPAGCDPHPPRGPGGLWVRIDRQDGVHHVVFTRPGPGAIILGLLIIGLIGVLAFFLLASIVLFWIPLLIAGILITFGWAAIRRRWHRVRAGALRPR
jgi:hypothetical protein